jgi:catechol 2,3-dioxygenase-like lactoylglutathione lyase family enzyme
VTTSPAARSRLIRRLAAVGVAVPDPRASAEWLRDALEFGLAAGRDGAYHLTGRGDYGLQPPGRMLTLRPGAELRLTEVTFEVVDDAALVQLGRQFVRLGVDVGEVPTDDEGGAGLRFQDPQGIEVWCRLRGQPFAESLALSTIRPNHLGHVNLKVPDAAAATRFYQQVLGLRVSEQVGELLFFLRATSEHHNLGFRSGAEQADVHHIGFEIEGWESFRIICDYLAARGHTVEYGPGRHGPGANIFIYVLEPSSGLRLELYTGMAHIHDEEAYTPPRWESLDRARTVNRWGPAPPHSYLL